MSRSVSLPLEVPVSAAGKPSACLPGSMRTVLGFSAIQCLLAAAYLRSVDPIARFAQRLARRLGLRGVEHCAFQIRIGWRQWFEGKLCSIAQTRILADIDCVLGFYEDMGYLLPPHPKEKLFSRLMDVLNEDLALRAEMSELQDLPIGATALRRRILALDACVETHLAALAHALVTGHVVLDNVVAGGVQ